MIVSKVFSVTINFTSQLNYEQATSVFKKTYSLDLVREVQGHEISKDLIRESQCFHKIKMQVTVTRFQSVYKQIEKDTVCEVLSGNK